MVFKCVDKLLQLLWGSAKSSGSGGHGDFGSHVLERVALLVVLIEEEQRGLEIDRSFVSHGYWLTPSLPV